MHPTFYFTWELFLSYLTQKVNRIWHPLEAWRLLKTESWAICGSPKESAVLQIKTIGTKKCKAPEKRCQQVRLTVNLTVQVNRRCSHRKGSGVPRISSKAVWKDIFLYKADPGRLEEVVIFQTCRPETKLQTTWRNRKTWFNQRNKTNLQKTALMKQRYMTYLTKNTNYHKDGQWVQETVH